MLTAADRSAIVELITRYGAYLDRREFARLADVFTADVALDYDMAGAVQGIDAAIDFFENLLQSTQSTQHMMHLPLVEVVGDVVRGYVHVTAHHVGSGTELPAPPEHVFTATATYHDVYRRTDAGWRIAARDTRIITVCGDPGALALPAETH